MAAMGNLTGGGLAGFMSVAGASPTGGVSGQAACAPGPNPLPVHALSSWEYRRRVAELTNQDVKVELPPDPIAQAPFAFSMALNDMTMQQLFIEAEAQAVAASAVKLLPCDPAQALDATCATKFIDGFVGGAFRRPLSDAERSRYISLYKLGSGAGDASGGVALVVQATLLSPLFLFKTYLGGAAKVGPQTSALTAYEVAGRLASLFNGAGLSPELSAEAEGGTLLNEDGVARQADRLLHDPRYIEVAQRFHAQWLGVDDLPTARPELAPELITSLRGQTEHFIADVFGGDRRLSSLLLSHDMFVDPLLAARYGMPAPSSGFIKVGLDDDYWGILTQASTLTRFSSPSERGQFVRQRLLCAAPVPPMPPGLVVDVSASPGQRERDAWMQTTSDAVCASCHSQVDPIGFAFGHFDRDGLYRNTDQGLPFDTSGSLVGPVTAPFKDLGDLATQLNRNPQVVDCVARTWLAYALERPLSEGDACAVQQLDAAFTGASFNFDALLTAIVRSTPFRTRDAYDIPNLPPPMPPLSGSAQDQNQRRKILLDFNSVEAMWLDQIVPAEDRLVIDRYLTMLRVLEQNLPPV